MKEEPLHPPNLSTTVWLSILFAGLLAGTGVMQTNLKSQPQIYLMVLGIVVLVSLFTKKFFKIPIPFYILLGIMLYVNIFMVTNFIADLLNPNDGWMEHQGEKRRVMGMNWVWGIFTGFILSWMMVLFYHKKIQKNKVLEIVFVAVFILTTFIIYYIRHIG